MLYASDGILANAVVKEVEILNLTSIFGKGYEPTLEEIEEHGVSGLVNMRAFYNNIIALKDTTNELLNSQQEIIDIKDDLEQHKLDYASLIIDTKTPLFNNSFALGTKGAFTADGWKKSDTIFNKSHLEYLPDKKAQKINMVFADQLIGQDFIVNSGDKIYYKINIIEKVDESKDIALYIALTDSINEYYASYRPVKITSIGESQGIFTSTKNASVFCFTASDGISANAVVKEVEILNLTSIFGKGHEPTLEEIEEHGVSGLVNMRAFYNNIIALKETTNELLKSQELINDLQFNINILFTLSSA